MVMEPLNGTIPPVVTGLIKLVLRYRRDGRKGFVMSTFLDLLRSGEELDCDLIIGNCDMPASFVWFEDNIITDYGVNIYRPIMEAEYTRLENRNIEIHCNDDKLGRKFCMAAAGYIGESEYEKIFGDH